MSNAAPIIFDDWAEYRLAGLVIEKLNRVNPRLPILCEAHSWSTDVEDQVLESEPVYGAIVSDSPLRIKHFYDELTKAVKLRARIEDAMVVDEPDPRTLASLLGNFPAAESTVAGLVSFYDDQKPED